MSDLLVKLIYPTNLCALLMIIAWATRKRAKVSAACLGSAIGILLLCGNGWFVGWAVRSLERQHPTPDPIPEAGCILVLGGGILPQEPPRQSIELNEAGDRMLYAVRLYRQGKAPFVLLAGGKAPGSTRETSEAEDEREILEFLGLPRAAIELETTSSNTHENAKKSHALLEQKKVQRVLLVTSALHMPRALGVFRRQMPGIEIIPAPTDYLATDGKPPPLMKELGNLMPSAGRLMQMEEILHEYLGIAYYKARGWM